MGKRLFVLEVPEHMTQAEQLGTKNDILAFISPYIGEVELFILDGGWRLKELTRPEVEWEEEPPAPVEDQLEAQG